MALFRGDGSRVTRANLVTAADPNPVLVIGEDLIEKSHYDRVDPDPAGSITRNGPKSGDAVPTTVVDSWFKPAVASTVDPESGDAAGGEVITIKGRDLDGVTDVKFGATSGTALTIVSAEELTVTTPVHAAGTVDLVFADDTGATTKVDGFTFA